MSELGLMTAEGLHLPASRVFSLLDALRLSPGRHSPRPRAHIWTLPLILTLALTPALALILSPS